MYKMLKWRIYSCFLTGDCSIEIVFCCFIVAAYSLISNSSWLQRWLGHNCRTVGSTGAVEQCKCPLSQENSTHSEKQFVSVFHLRIEMWPKFGKKKTYKCAIGCQTWPVFFRQALTFNTHVWWKFTFNGFYREWELQKWQREHHRKRSYFSFLCTFCLINQSNISELCKMKAFQYCLSRFGWDVCRRQETCN